MLNNEQEREEAQEQVAAELDTEEQPADDEMPEEEEVEETTDAQDDDLTDDEVLAREMVTYISGYLVDDKDAIQVGTEWEGDRLTVSLKVADDDKGKVIGRNGRVVRAMQSLLRVSAVKSYIRTNLDVV